MKNWKTLGLALGLCALPAFASTGLVPAGTIDAQVDAENAAMVSETPDFGIDIGGRHGGVHIGIGHRAVQCSAENLRGQIFTAVGDRGGDAQWRALERCRSVSYSCRAIGCERI